MSAPPSVERRRMGLLCVLLMMCSATLYASDIKVTSARSEIRNDMFIINANASFTFSEDALKALRSGVPLVIDLDVRLTRPRRYLWDRVLVKTHRRYQIERHALSNQYVVTDLITGVHRIEKSLEQAIGDLGRVRDLPIVEASELAGEHGIDVAMRLRLDIESLPAPLIPLAYISPGWHMSSGWYEWRANP